MTKRILVTGGNKGIGKAICERLLTHYDDTYVLLGSRDLERGQSAVSDILKSCADKAKDRLECILLDTSSDESVAAAAKKLSTEPELYGIINNAGIGWGYKVEENVNVNYLGVKRVNEVIGPYVKRPGGRIVNIASASGPNFVEALPKDSPLKTQLPNPWTIPCKDGHNHFEALDDIGKEYADKTDNGYGFSKALLNAYTWLYAKKHPDLIVNSCTPGFILTDMTVNVGAKDPTSKGAVPPCFLMMDTDTIPNEPTGRYYGSDCKRSPVHKYRSPGDDPYASTEDLVELEAFGSK